MTNYVLQHPMCESCVHSKDGFYNRFCAHCPCCTYSKSSESSYMSKGMFGFMNIIKENKKETEND